MRLLIKNKGLNIIMQSQSIELTSKNDNAIVYCINDFKQPFKMFNFPFTVGETLYYKHMGNYVSIKRVSNTLLDVKEIRLKAKGYRKTGNYVSEKTLNIDSYEADIFALYCFFNYTKKYKPCSFSEFYLNCVEYIKFIVGCIPELNNLFYKN